MKLKKIAALILTTVFAGALFAGCGQDNKSDTAVSEAEKKLGMISHMNLSESQYNSLLKTYEARAGVKLSHKIVFYDDLNSLQMGLQSKSIDEMSVYQSVGNYITSKDSGVEVIEKHSLGLTDSFCCAVRADDVDLKNSIDDAIKSMEADGTLDNLIKKYITELKEDPPAVEITKIEGADTIKVGVTGDLPPLDLILADGKPAGFNTAVLSELSKRIDKNIELIQINSASRAAALNSKKIDVVFWATKPVGDAFPVNVDKPDGIDLTAPYYEDNVVHIELRK